MNNFRNVQDDILKDWLEYRETIEFAYVNDEDKKHLIYIDKISEKILKNVPLSNQTYVKQQLDEIEKNFLDYITYWNEKYYRNGFCDGIQLLAGSIQD